MCKKNDACLSTNKRKETVREARRRRAWWCLKNNCQQKELDEAEASIVRAAIDGNKPSFFGIERVAAWDLERGVIRDAPSWLRSGPEFSVMSYASVRGRTGILESLLKKGIRPLWKSQQFWALREVEATALEDKIMNHLDVASVAPVLCLAARSLEFGLGKNYTFKWISTTHTGRSHWHGCGCVFLQALDFWKLLLQDIFDNDNCTADHLRCPHCGEGGMPRPTTQKWSAKKRRKMRVPKIIRIARTEGQVRPSVWFDAVQRMPLDTVKELAAICNVHLRDECGATAVHYAAIRGDSEDFFHQDIFNGIANMNAVCGSSGTPSCFALTPHEIREHRRNLFIGNGHKMTNDQMYYVRDDALPSQLLSDLDALFLASQPKLAEGRSSDDAVERRHFIDPAGILERHISKALQMPVCLAPKAKFLNYRHAGAELASHIDLCKSTKWLGPRHRTSTSHTWMIYLTKSEIIGDNDAGATVLLSSLQPDSIELFKVHPKRGRLFVFPHRHPHAARPTCDGQHKLVVRGELFFWQEEKETT